jgi:hypothetical protein
MNKRFLAAIFALAAGAGVALGQGRPVPVSPAFAAAMQAQDAYYNAPRYVPVLLVLTGDALPGPVAAEPPPTVVVAEAQQPTLKKAETKPAEIKLPDAKPVEVKPDAAKPADAKPAPAPGWHACDCSLPALCATARPCGPRGYFLAEYLLWDFRGTGPTLAGVSNGGAPDFAASGVTLNPNQYSGGRAFAGLWLDDDRVFGVEIGGFGLGQGTSAFAGTEFRQVVGPVVVGSDFVGVQNHLDTALYGGEINFVGRMSDHSSPGLNVLVGVRYLGLTERYDVVTQGNIGATSLGSVGKADTDNQMLLGQLGVQAAVCRGRWTGEVIAKVGLGGNWQSRDVVQPTPGGVVGGPSDAPDDTRFVVVPEGTIRVGYRFSNSLSAFVGYNYLYVSDVVRPTADTAPAPAGSPFAHAPVLGSESTDFWAHGVSFGVRLTY